MYCIIKNGPQSGSFIERLFLLCPSFGVPFIRGSTVLCPGQLPVLTTLQIAHNRLRTAEDIEELAHCSKLRYISVYRIALIFRGSKFSRIAALKEFVE